MLLPYKLMVLPTRAASHYSNFKQKHYSQQTDMKYHPG